MRNYIAKNRGVAAIGATLLIIAAAFLAYVQMAPTAVQATTKFYFIDEDKVSYADCFTAPRDSIPPFDHNGRHAVRAHVFDVDGKRVVGYLEKLTPEGKKAMEAHKAKLAAASAAPSAKAANGESVNGMPVEVAMEMAYAQLLVKRPGDKEWTPKSDPQKAFEIASVFNAKGERAQTVYPEP